MFGQKFFPIQTPVVKRKTISLDGYVAGSPAVEKKRAAQAFAQVAENLRSDGKHLAITDRDANANALEVKIVMIEDPAAHYEVEGLIDAGKSAPRAILDSYEKTAQTFEAMDDKTFREHVAYLREVGDMLAGWLVEKYS